MELEAQDAERSGSLSCGLHRMFTPGTLAGLFMILPTWWMAKRFSDVVPAASRPRFGAAASRRRSGRYFAKVVILGEFEYGIFTPTEASAVAQLT